MQLSRFRGFQRLHVDLVPNAYIIGPNSAGKSTVIEAIELATRCLRVARRKVAHDTYIDYGERRRGFSLAESGFSETDPIRHDFGSDEVRVQVTWTNGASVHLVWPDESTERAPFFYLQDAEERNLTTPTSAKNHFTGTTIVPVITPLDHVEPLKDQAYVDQHASTRLSSRHFRNHAYRMSRSGEWANFRTYCSEWLPELELLEVSFSLEANRLSVFYRESGSRIPKELAWAGDGIQIWIQLLWHLFKIGTNATVVLDEPEVYLHPDLQRRLVRLLESQPRQVILASHSAEVVAEAANEGIVWIDRRTIGARRTKSDNALSTLSSHLGSRFNLALARSMRSKVTVASDCRDPRLLSALGKSVGASKLATEDEVSFIQLGDATHHLSPAEVAANLRQVLPASVQAVVVLQRGLRTWEATQELEREIVVAGVRVFVLRRNELENYLLEPDAISRVSGVDRTAAAVKLAETISRLRPNCRSAYVSARLSHVNARFKTADVTGILSEEFEQGWSTQSFQIEVIPGSTAILELSSTLQRDGYRGITNISLARALKPQHMAAELFAMLLEINEMAGV